MVWTSKQNGNIKLTRITMNFLLNSKRKGGGRPRKTWQNDFDKTMKEFWMSSDYCMYRKRQNRTLMEIVRQRQLPQNRLYIYLFYSFKPTTPGIKIIRVITTEIECISSKLGFLLICTCQQKPMAEKCLIFQHG